MSKSIIIRTTCAILATLIAALAIACGDSDAGLSRADVTDIVRSEIPDAPAPVEQGPSMAEVERIVQDSIADIPEPKSGITTEEVEEIVRDFIGYIPEPAAPGVTDEEVEQIVQAAIMKMTAAKPEGAKAVAAPSKSSPDIYTQYLVKDAIKKYQAEGLDDTVDYYNMPESIDGQWYVFVIDEDGMLLSHAANPDLVGLHVSEATGPNAFPAGDAVFASADEDGEWYSYNFTNPATGGVEAKHSWMVTYDGLIFGTGWYEAGPDRSDAPAYTQALVEQAINLYDAVGRSDTVDYYNMPESIDGQWYVFVIDDDGVIISHAAFPDLVGQHVSETTGPNAFPSGDAVFASADEDGEWYSYNFTNPATGGVEAKHSWMVKYDGLIFGTGWYEAGPNRSDAPAYTQALVEQAIDLYDAVGLDITVDYYNMPESIDGQWYVFIGSNDGMLLSHAANPDLVGRHASEAIGPNAFPAGSAVFASADEDGEWYSYNFTNPATGGVQSKHSWIVEYDGLVFGTGWYESGPARADAPAYTQALVKQAIDLYDTVGLGDTVDYYNMPESIDGQWYVFIIDEEDTIIAHAANSSYVGGPASDATGPNAFPAGDAVAASADADGEWFSYTFPNPASGGVETKHSWMVEYDGLVFGTGWYEAGPAKSDPPAYTQALVRQAIALYDAVGLDDTVAYYNMPESIDGQWYVFIGDQAEDSIIAHAANPSLVGVPTADVRGPNAYPAGTVVAASADQDGEWSSYTFANPATGAVETKHSWTVAYDGLFFGSGWYEAGPNKSDAPAYTQALVQQAIGLYDTIGLESTVEYYNTPESIDGQWYIFLFDENDVLLTHAANPDLVNRHASEVFGPNAYPTGEAVAASGDQDGEWFSYTFTNPATGGVETKHSWIVEYDGLKFGTGWYEAGPAKSDGPAFTRAFVQQAINLYNAVGRDRTIDYYNTTDSVDGQWYTFIVDGDGYTIAHHNEMFRGRDPAERIDSTGYFYGDELTGATETGRWVSYQLLNPETGDERQKHTWAVLYDGLIFASGWYEQ